MDKIKKERGAVALMTLSFLFFIVSVSLALLWTIVQIFGASSLMQSTAQTAAYAATNTSVTNNINITCESANQNNHFLCWREPGKNAAALDTVESVFAQAFQGGTRGTYGLCYPASSCAQGQQAIRIVARNGTANSPRIAPSIKVFNINLSGAKDCKVYDGGGRYTQDLDLGFDPIRTDANNPSPSYLCWFFSEKRGDQFYRIKEFFYRTPGVIVRARVDFRVLGGFLGSPTIPIEGIALATKSQPLAPSNPGDY